MKLKWFETIYRTGQASANSLDATVKKTWHHMPTKCWLQGIHERHKNQTTGEKHNPKRQFALSLTRGVVFLPPPWSHFLSQKTWIWKNMLHVSQGWKGPLVQIENLSLVKSKHSASKPWPLGTPKHRSETFQQVFILDKNFFNPDPKCRLLVPLFLTHAAGIKPVSVYRKVTG